MASARTSIQVEDGVCNRADCYHDEPTDLVTRRFKGTDFKATYCTRHDPVDDPEVSHLWEVVYE